MWFFDGFCHFGPPLMAAYFCSFVNRNAKPSRYARQKTQTRRDKNQADPG